MKEAKLLGAFIGLLGVVVLVVVAYVVTTGRIVADDLYVLVGYGVLGVCMIVAGVGFWNLRRWGMVSYACFFITRTVIRFPEVRPYDMDEIIRYALWTIVWFLLGLRLWKKLSHN